MSTLEVWTMVYAIATIVMAIILGLAVWWARGQVAEAKHSRQLSCLTTLSERWSSHLIREARRMADSASPDFDTLWKTLKAQQSDDYFKLASLANFFEDLAILEKEGQVTFEQLVDRFGPTLTYYHDMYKGFILEKQREDPRILENFDRLARRVPR